MNYWFCPCQRRCWKLCLCLCATCGDGEGVASFRLGVSPRQSLLVQSTHTEALKVFFQNFKHAGWRHIIPETVLSQKKTTHLALWRWRGGVASRRWRRWTLFFLLLRLVLGLILGLRAGGRWWSWRWSRYRGPQLVLVPRPHPVCGETKRVQDLPQSPPVVAVVAIVPFHAYHPFASSLNPHFHNWKWEKKHFFVYFGDSAFAAAP